MTHDHDNTPHAIFNTISGTCWKVSEFIDFDSDLPVCFSALICDFFSVYKNDENQVLRIFENLLFMDS